MKNKLHGTQIIILIILFFVPIITSANLLIPPHNTFYFEYENAEMDILSGNLLFCPDSNCTQFDNFSHEKIRAKSLDCKNKYLCTASITIYSDDSPFPSDDLKYLKLVIDFSDSKKNNTKTLSSNVFKKLGEYSKYDVLVKNDSLEVKRKLEASKVDLREYDWKHISFLVFLLIAFLSIITIFVLILLIIKRLAYKTIHKIKNKK